MVVAQKRGQRTTHKARELRYDAGALSLNLVATVGRRLSQPVERLETPERLAEWFAAVDLAVASNTIDQELLSAMRSLREALYVLLSALMSASAPPPNVVDTVNAYASTPVPPPRLTWAGSTAYVELSPREGLPGMVAVAMVARDLVERLRDPRWATMLRTCAATDCGMVFLDRSQAGRRRWCSMETCGNRVKAAAHRARYGHE